MTRAKLAAALSELRLKNLLSSQPWGLVCDASFRALFEEWGIDKTKIISVQEVEAGALGNDAHRLVVVCTEKPEGPVQRQLKDLNVQSFGLFSQLIPRLAAGLPPRYHHRTDQPIKLEYAIMCLPRCGSTLVSRELRQAHAGDPVEHFRGYVQDLLRERDVSRFDFTRWWEMVRFGHNIDGVFGTKIIYDFWKMAEKFMLKDEIDVIYNFLRGVPVVYIERSDKYGQAVSDTVARQTGVWHLWSDSMKQKYAEKLEGLDGNLKDAVASYNKFRRNERELERLLETVAGRIIKVEYDDLVTNPKETMANVVKELGLELPGDYLASPLALEPTTSDAHKILRERLREELR